MADHTAYQFRMRQLPKAEYALMKSMIDKYDLKDPSELVTCLLRFTYEVLHLSQVNGQGVNGQAWWIQVINQWRSDPQEERVYELP